MKRPTDRRTILIAAGAAALAAATGPADAQSTEIQGEVTFRGGAAIPAGQIEIYLEDPAMQDPAQRRIAQTQLVSDGVLRTMPFSLSRPASAAASPPLLIIARLVRPDGWLLARGNSQVQADAPVNLALNPVIY